MHLQIVLNQTEWYFLLVSTFLFGSLIGSFLNVVIHRLPLGESIVFPNSNCPRCHEKIRFYDNIPIVSWLVLSGKCRACRAPILFRYPLVELLTALTFALFFVVFNLNLWLFVCLFFSAAIISLIFIDAEQMILPDAVNYPALILVLLTRLIFGAFFQAVFFDDLNVFPLAALNQPDWFKSLLGAILGAAVGGGSLWLVGFLYKQLRNVEAMGLGDVKMMSWVGAFLGWRLTILTIFLAAFGGALCGIVWLKYHRNKDYQTQIPFGIFLGIGSLISLLFGTKVVEWYLDKFVLK